MTTPEEMRDREKFFGDSVEEKVGVKLPSLEGLDESIKKGLGLREAHEMMRPLASKIAGFVGGTLTFDENGKVIHVEPFPTVGEMRERKDSEKGGIKYGN